MAQEYFLSQNLFISNLCAKMLHVTWALKGVTNNLKLIILLTFFLGEKYEIGHFGTFVVNTLRIEKVLISPTFHRAPFSYEKCFALILFNHTLAL